MKRLAVLWKMLLIYLFVLYLLCYSTVVFSQITAIHFNAGFNSANDVEWFNKLKVGKKKESPSEQKMREQFFVDMENTIFKPDMSTLKHFTERDYMEALSYLNINESI